MRGRVMGRVVADASPRGFSPVLSPDKGRVMASEGACRDGDGVSVPVTQCLIVCTMSEIAPVLGWDGCSSSDAVDGTARVGESLVPQYWQNAASSSFVVIWFCLPQLGQMIIAAFPSALR